MEYTQTTAPSVVPLSDANTQRRDAKAGKKGFGAPRSPLGLGAANKAPGKLLIPTAGHAYDAGHAQHSLAAKFREHG